MTTITAFYARWSSNDVSADEAIECERAVLGMLARSVREVGYVLKMCVNGGDVDIPDMVVKWLDRAIAALEALDVEDDAEPPVPLAA
jgi:hypothetical protein